MMNIVMNSAKMVDRVNSNVDYNNLNYHGLRNFFFLLTSVMYSYLSSMLMSNPTDSNVSSNKECHNIKLLTKVFNISHMRFH